MTILVISANDVYSTQQMLEFLETSVFTDMIVELLSDTEYSELQATLILRPEAGDIIKETAGLRKIRWGESKRGKGKRGGIRIIYYWYDEEELIYMLLAYSKGEKADLSAREKRVLRALVASEFE